MNASLNRVLLAWADSRWTWFPWSRLRPSVEQPMGAPLLLAHVVSGLVWAGLLGALIARGLMGRWSATAFAVPAVFGMVAALLWQTMIRLAWNRRAAEHRRLAAAGQAPPPPVPPSVVDRWVVRPVAVAAVLVVSLAFVVAFENLRGALALRGAQNGLRAQGVPMTLADIVPPPVPDERNLAMAPFVRPLMEHPRTSEDRLVTGAAKPSFATVAKSRKQTDRAWTDGGRVDLELWQFYYRSIPDWPKPASPGTPAADVLMGLGRGDEDLAELRAAAAAHPDCRFPIQYQDHYAALLPHLAPLKGWAQFLRLRAVALLAEGRTDEALADTLLGLRLSDAIREEPLVISHLVRLAIDQLMLQPVWEGCLDQRWNDRQLVALQRALESRNPFGHVTRALHGERIIAGLAFDEMARRVFPMGRWGTVIEGMSDGHSNDPALNAFVRCIPRGWVRQNQVAHIRYVQAVVEDLARAPHHAALIPPGRHMDRFIDKRSLFTVLAAILAPSAERPISRTYEGEAWRRLALTGLALERHRLASGAFPESLQGLVPGFLNEVPADPMDGQPLRYTRTAEGDYHLYSVGLDHQDHNGQRRVRDPGTEAGRSIAGDLVWR